MSKSEFFDKFQYDLNKDNHSQVHECSGRIAEANADLDKRFLYRKVQVADRPLIGFALECICVLMAFKL